MLRHFRNIAAACLLASLASGASAEVVKQDAHSFVTRDTAKVTASPREVWMTLIAPAKWWNPTHSWSGDAANMTLTPQGGGCFCERIPQDPKVSGIPLSGSSQHMVVLLAMPDSVLRMRGGLGPLQSEPVDGVLTITLKPVDGGTQILWEYVVGGFFRYEVPVIAKAVDGVMSEQLGRLAGLLGPVAPAKADKAEPSPATPEPERTTVDEAFGDIGS